MAVRIFSNENNIPSRPIVKRRAGGREAGATGGRVNSPLFYPQTRINLYANIPRSRIISKEDNPEQTIGKGGRTVTDLRKVVEAALAHPCLALIGRAVCAVVRGMSACVRSACGTLPLATAPQPAPLPAPIVFDTAFCARFAHPARSGIASCLEDPAVHGIASSTALHIGTNGKACACARAFPACMQVLYPGDLVGA